MRLAYFEQEQGNVQVVFPNDSFPRFVSTQPLLTDSDFVHAKIVDSGEEFGKVIEATITDKALAKFNAAAQQKNTPGLGVFIKGRPVNLFQSIHSLPEPILWLTGLSDSEMKALVQLLSN